MFYPQIAELCFSLIILVVWLSNKKIRTDKTRAFLLVLISSLINATTDLIVRFFYYSYDPTNKLQEIIIRIYLFSYIILATTTLIYFKYSLINYHQYKISKPFIVMVFFVSASLMLHLPFTASFETGSIHFTGLATIFPYYYVLFVSILCLFYILIYRKYIIKQDVIGALLMVLFYFLGGLARYLNAKIELTGFSYVIGVFFLYLTIENPENYRDSESELLFYNVFYDYMLEQTKAKNKKAIAYIYLKNNIIEDKYIISNEIFKQTIKSFKKDKNSYIFRGNWNELIFVSDNLNKIENLIENYVKSINNSQEYLKILSRSISTILIIPDSNLVKDVDDFSKIFKLMNEKNNRYKNYVSVDRYDLDTSYMIQNEELILKEIDNVIDNKKIDLQFSFIFDNNNNKCGTEVSAKILTEDGRILDPSQYIKVAIKYAKIAAINDLIFEKVALLIRDGFFSNEIKYILVKTSIIRFEDQNYAKKLHKLIEKYQIDPSRICLELTNTETINNKASVIKTMKMVNDFGIKLVLGGFGQNEANLNYLIDLPVFGIKFHKDTLSSLLKNNQGKIILENVIKAAHLIDVKTIMTNISNQDDYDLAIKLENDMLEGEYLSKEVAVDKTKTTLPFDENKL